MCRGKEREKCHKDMDPKCCTPLQIKECHGDVKEHECEKPKEKKTDK